MTREQMKHNRPQQNYSNRPLLLLECLERRELLAGDLDLSLLATIPATSDLTTAYAVTIGQNTSSLLGAPYTNTITPLDVNGDRRIDVDDIQAIVDDLNHFGIRELPRSKSSNESTPSVDVNGDGSVSPIDALQVINYLNTSVKIKPVTTRSVTGSDSAPADRSSFESRANSAKALPTFRAGDELVLADGSRFVYQTSNSGYLHQSLDDKQRFAAVEVILEHNSDPYVEKEGMVGHLHYIGECSYHRDQARPQRLSLHGIRTAEPMALTNPTHPYDVDASGRITAADVDRIIATLNTVGPRKLDSYESPDRLGFVDTNADGAVTPLDTLLVINFLNRRNR